MSENRLGQEDRRSPSFLSEVLHYLRYQKRWWLTPIVLVLLLLAVVALLAGLAPVLPFIYTIF